MQTFINASPISQMPGKKRLQVLFGACCLLASLFFGTVQADPYDTFTFSNILERHTEATQKGFFQHVEVNYADPAGGELVVFLGNPGNTCSEQYLVTWTFSRDLQTVSPNDAFSADYTIIFEGGNCKGVHAPVVEIMGTSSTKLVDDYAQKCEADLSIASAGPQNIRKARVDEAGHVELIVDGAIRKHNNRSAACGYAHITINVKSKGTEFELVYVYLSQ